MRLILGYAAREPRPATSTEPAPAAISSPRAADDAGGTVRTLVPADRRARVLAELARVLHEDFDIPRDRIRPDASLVDLGLAHFHWWVTHEAVLEVLPELGTHPSFNDLSVIHEPLGRIAAWGSASAAALRKPPKVHPHAPRMLSEACALES